MARPSRAASDKQARDGEVSAADVARSLHLSKQAIGLWLRRPGAPVRWVGARAFVRVPDFHRWREQELQRQAVEEATAPLRRQLESAQQGSPHMRKANAEARMAELDVEEREKSVVRVEEVVRIIDVLLTALRKKLLAIPAAWAPALFGASNMAELTMRLHRQVVAELLPTLATPPDLTPTDAPAAEEVAA
jgi:hypothetical protein